RGAGHPARPDHPNPRRVHQPVRRRERSEDSQDTARVHARADDVRHHAPAEHAGDRGPHRRHRRRPHRRRGHPQGAAGELPRLPAPARGSLAEVVCLTRNCKLQNANCKMQIEERPRRCSPASGCFPICNLHFAICILQLCLLLAWLYLLLLHGLGRRDLWNSHEARAAMNAQSLLDGGDWLLPRLYDDRPELQKPPLYYWLVALSARLRGGPVDAWDVRLPSALGALLCAGVLAALGRACGRTRAGLVAALVLLTATHFTWLARVGRIDMPLTCAVTVALCGFYLAQRPETSACRRLACLATAYVAVAAAVLLKGPIGVVLPASAFGAYLLAERRLPRGLGLWWGVPLVLVLALPWFWAADRATDGELVRVFF